MHVSGFGYFTFCEPMDTREDEVAEPIDFRHDEFDHKMDINEDIENIDEENAKKRRKEDQLRPTRQDAGTARKKAKLQKRVTFIDLAPTWEVHHDAMELDPPYDLTKSAKEQGWIIKNDEHEIFRIHPQALRSMPDTDFIYIAQQNPSFSMLSFCDGQEITDFGFCQVIQGRHNLKAIDISLAPNMTNNTLQALVNHCPLLRECSLIQCPNVNDRGVRALVKHCKGLRSLSFDWCYGVGDNSLYAIGEYCPRLLELSLIEGTQFSLTAFKALLKGCLWLEKLDLWSCTQINDTWIDAIIRWGKNIKELEIKYCSNISPQAIDRLKASLPHLNLIQ